MSGKEKKLVYLYGFSLWNTYQIENLLKTNPFIVNAVALGDRRKFISALLVPNFEKLEAYAQENNIEFKGRIDLIENDLIKKKMEEEVVKSTENLARYEKIKKFALLERDFEIDQGELTPTLKVKRSIVEEKYKDMIDSFYKED